MEEVEIANIAPPLSYEFEGQKDLNSVKFNTPHILKVYELITSVSNKQSIGTVSSAILQLYPQLLSLSESQSCVKPVCAKIITQGETIVQCLNCRIDESCIICLNCFKNSNHEGHKVLYKKAAGGCCDCGDAQAWKPEGFCKEHSGEAQDIAIDPASISAFLLVLQDLFYLYFRLKLTKENQKMENVTFITILNIFDKVIEKGPKGIKLLALALQSCLPSNLQFNHTLQKQAIITHIFTWRFIGRDLTFWERIFIKMFPYYEFKKVLLATYIQCFPILYVCEEACQIGSSLSCQILTSYKLVEDYVDSHNSQPIGYNAGNITDTNQMDCFCTMLCSDLYRILKLQDPVPEKYARLLISKGINTLFDYYRALGYEMVKEKQLVEKVNKTPQVPTKKKKKKKKQKEMQIEEGNKVFFNPIFFMIRKIRQASNQYEVLTLFNLLLRVIKNDRLILKKALKEFALLMENDFEELIIFRPYDRAFAITLFALCQEKLEKLLQTEFRKEIMDLLNKNEEEFEKLLKKMQERMLATYLFYTHILCNEDRGYHSSFFHYIYLYRSKGRFLISADTLQLKMIALLSKTRPTLNFEKLLKFQDFDEEKWSLFILKTLYQELQLLYLGDFSQIYISNFELEELSQKKEIGSNVINYFAKFIVGEGNTVTLERAVQFGRTFLFDDPELVKRSLLQCCSYIKDRKIFELKPAFRAQQPFNYENFELRLKDDKFVNKNNEQSRPELTYCLISGYNKAIFEHYWNDDNLEKFKGIYLNLYEEIAKTQVHDNMVDLAASICKFCANLRAFGSPEQQLIVDELLLRAPFTPDVKHKLTQYKDIIGGEEVQVDIKLNAKKELLMMKKMKKLEEIRKKKEENMSAVRQVHNIEEESHHTDEDFCAICRKKDNEKSQFVYLVSLTIRDLQKLAKLGSGVETISFTSCYHIFDYECLEKQVNSAYEGIFKCPICRKTGNIFVPVFPLADQEKSHPFVKACIERITQIMMTIHSYRQIDPVQELFKAFYHYALLSLFEEEYVRKSRLKLYRTILEMLSHFEIQGSILDLIQKFIHNQINLIPKLLKKDKVNIIDLKAEEEYMVEDEQDEEYEDDEQGEQSLIVVQVVAKNSLTKKPSSKTKTKKVVYSNNFKYVGLRILRSILEDVEQKNLKGNISSQKPVKKESQANMIQGRRYDASQSLKQCIMPEVEPSLQLAIDELLATPSHQKIQTKPYRLQFIQLPEYFDWDMSKNDCDLCHQPCHDLFVCLICRWKGCLNCKPGGVYKHVSVAHGETSAFIRINEGIIYIMGNKIIKKIGCLYLNQWGEPLRLKNDWSSFSLQRDVLDKARSMLLRDE